MLAKSRRQKLWLGLGAAALAMALLTGCASRAVGDTPVAIIAEQQTPTTEPAAASPSPTDTAVPSATPIPIVSATPTVTPTASPTLAPDTATPTQAPPTPLPPLIAIDPGHGGPDIGARHFDAEGHMDFCEAEINLALSLMLRDILLDRDYRVFMTRDADYGHNPDELDLNGDEIVDHVDELQTRLDMINDQGADMLISIHQNAYYDQDGPAEDVGGLVTFYCQDRAFGEENLLLGELVHGELLDTFAEIGYDIHDRGVLDDLVLMTPDEPGTHLIVLGPTSDRIVRPSKMPGILSETLFITHAREAELIQDTDVQQKLALAYADGIEAFLAALAADDATP